MGSETVPESSVSGSKRATGPILTLLMVGLIEALSWRHMPALPLVLMLVIAYSVLTGGLGAGIASSAISLAYAAYYYGSPAAPFRYSGENLERLMIFVVSTPLVLAVLANLRRRLDELLVRERSLRRQADAERERVVSILESVTDGFFALDRQWRYTYVNHRAERLVGRTREELLGKVVWEAFPALVGSAWDREYHRAIEQQVSTEFEEFYPPLDTWFETHAYPSKEGLTIYLRSVNPRKRAEQALRVRARQQAAVASFGREALHSGDIRSLMDTAVRTLASTLEVELAKVLELLPDGRELVMRAGVGWKEGVEHRVDASGRSQAAYTLASSGPVIVTELAAETRFQGPTLLLDHGVVSGMSVIIAGHDRPFGILGVHSQRKLTFTEDDTHFLQAVANMLAEAIERKRSVEALAESEQRFRQLAENVREVFYINALHPTQVLYVSPAYEVIWGRPCASLYEQPSSWIEAIHPDDRPDIAESLAGRDSGFFEGEYRVVRPDGSIRWIRDRSSPVLDGGDRAYRVVGIAEDITEQREAAQAASRLASSEASVRTRDEVLAVVAHDLRNPLSAISTAASLLGEAELAPEARAKHARAIKRAIDSAERLIQDLLDAARIEAGQLTIEPEALDIASLLAEARDAFQYLSADKSVAFECAVGEDLPRAYGDRDRIFQILGNLLANAIKFTPAGGRVTVRCQRCPDGIAISVGDTGPGIDEAALPHVFDRFWRARPADRKGLGLGLAIVKGLVDAHHGRVWAESELGRGSTFHFTVPFAPAQGR